MYIHLRDKDFMNAEEFEAMFGPKGLHEELGAENEKMGAPEHIKSNEQAKARDTQIAGNHYKKMRVQPWDVIDDLPHAQAIGFYRGNAIKYIMRAGEKGPAKTDYEKAIHYLQKLIESL